MQVAALDIGLKRIGVALCLDGQTVLPQEAIIRTGRQQAADEVRGFLQKWSIDTLIVGLPRGGASEAEMERRIRHFIRLIDPPETLKLYYQDEAGTSQEAKEHLRGITRHKRDGRIDSMAAKLILERWLEGAE
jgi:putative Holliday junction resolvase